MAAAKPHDTRSAGEAVAAERDRRRDRAEHRRDRAGVRDVNRVENRAAKSGQSQARQELRDRPSRLLFPKESRLGAARRQESSDPALDAAHEAGFDTELGEARRRAARRAGQAAGESRPAQMVQETAGFVLGLLAWALALAFLRSGPAGVKQWIRAKFINDPGKAATAVPTTPLGRPAGGVVSPATPSAAAGQQVYPSGASVGPMTPYPVPSNAGSPG
jgi:hypothetical protein